MYDQPAESLQIRSSRHEDGEALFRQLEEVSHPHALPDLILTKKEELARDVKVRGSHGSSYCEMVEFRILR